MWVQIKWNIFLAFLEYFWNLFEIVHSKTAGKEKLEIIPKHILMRYAVDPGCIELEGDCEMVWCIDHLKCRVCVYGAWTGASRASEIVKRAGMAIRSECGEDWGVDCNLFHFVLHESGPLLCLASCMPSSFSHPQYDWSSSSEPIQLFWPQESWLTQSVHAGFVAQRRAG